MGAFSEHARRWCLSHWLICLTSADIFIVELFRVVFDVLWNIFIFLCKNITLPIHIGITPLGIFLRVLASGSSNCPNIQSRLSLPKVQLGEKFKCKIVNIFLFIHLNICLGYSIEPSQWDCSIVLLGAPQQIFWLRYKKTKFLFLPLVANSVDPDEMLHYMAFPLGLHCLPKYSLRSHH